MLLLQELFAVEPPPLTHTHALAGLSPTQVLAAAQEAQERLERARSPATAAVRVGAAVVVPAVDSGLEAGLHGRHQRRLRAPGVVAAGVGRDGGRHALPVLLDPRVGRLGRARAVLGVGLELPHGLAAGGAPHQPREAVHLLLPRSQRHRAADPPGPALPAEEVRAGDRAVPVDVHASIGAVGLPDARRAVRLSVAAGRALLALAVVVLAAAQCLASPRRAGRLRRQSVQSARSARQFGDDVARGAAAGGAGGLPRAG
eukprot:gene18204-21189_t